MWMKESRKTPRAPLGGLDPLPCQVQTLGRPEMIPAELRDLSEGGAALSFRGEGIPWQAGQQVIVRFQLPDSRTPSRLFAEIRHARRSPQGELIIGVRFGEEASPTHLAIKLRKIREFVMRILGRGEKPASSTTAVPGTLSVRPSTAESDPPDAA